MIRVSKEFSLWDIVPGVLIAMISGEISMKPLFISDDIGLGLFCAFFSIFASWICYRLYLHRGQVYIGPDQVCLELDTVKTNIPVSSIHEIWVLSSSGPLMLLEYEDSSGDIKKFKFRPKMKGLLGSNMTELNRLIDSVGRR